MALLRKGMASNSVQILQEKLIAQHFDLVADGNFGYKTDVIVREFQRSNGLVPDGIVGATTWAVLKQGNFLKDDLTLKTTPVNPPIPLELTGSPSTDTLIQIRNWWGQLVGAIARRETLDPCVLFAVLAVESGGVAFVDNKMVIRFENHVFARQKDVSLDWVSRNLKYSDHKPWENHRVKLNGEWRASHIWPRQNSIQANQAREWQAYELAAQHNKTAAIRSISMGLPQMMGFNYRLLGYNTEEAMFTAFSTAAHPQVLGMFDFIIGVEPYSPMLGALLHNNFYTFAKHYNGTGKAQEYGSLIKGKYEKARQLNLGDNLC